MDKRKKGRPRIDDSATMSAAYDLMETDPKISFASALKRTGVRHPSDIARHQAKRRVFRKAMKEAYRWRGGASVIDWAVIG